MVQHRQDIDEEWIPYFYKKGGAGVGGPSKRTEASLGKRLTERHMLGKKSLEPKLNCVKKEKKSNRGYQTRRNQVCQVLRNEKRPGISGGLGLILTVLHCGSGGLALGGGDTFL